jgi:hypothetical protein
MDYEARITSGPSMMDRTAFKSVAQLRALAGAWRERADNATSPSLAEQMRLAAREFDDKAAEMEKRTKG